MESWNLPTPLCRRCDLPHSRISAPCPLYRESPLFTRGEIAVWVCVLYWGCAGIIVPCTALLFAPTGIACGGRTVPHRGSRLGTPPWFGGKIHRAGRELPEEEAGCLIECQAAFFRSCSLKKIFQNDKTGGPPSGTQYQNPRKKKKERLT